MIAKWPMKFTHHPATLFVETKATSLATLAAQDDHEAHSERQGRARSKKATYCSCAKKNGM